MPTKRRPISRPARLGDLDPAVAGYLLDGNLRAALVDLKARGEGVLILWLGGALAKLWRQHRVALEAEAGRRGIKPWWPRREAEMAKAAPKEGGDDGPAVA